ncbi:MAG: hypothetical protein IPL40_04365 [Proteobacteria bacterium]|nr:hypothetical protein [Pseudomonadota bacterium]
MREELKLLEELQGVDLELQETDKALQALPLRLQELKHDVESVDALLVRERKQLEDVQRYRGELEQSLQRDQDQLNKTKAKLTQVKTSREYMAVQREFESSRRLINERELELAKLTGAIDQTQESVLRHEQELEGLRTHFGEEEQATATQMAALEQQVAGRRGERAALATRVSKTVVRKYEQIRRQRGGLGLAAAREGVCGGCRMHLPPQLYNILQRAETLEQCPNCQRIVYFPDQSEAPASAPFEADAALSAAVAPVTLES